MSWDYGQAQASVQYRLALATPFIGEREGGEVGESSTTLLLPLVPGREGLHPLHRLLERFEFTNPRSCSETVHIAEPRT